MKNRKDKTEADRRKSAAPPEECMSTDYRLQWYNINKDRCVVFCKLQGQLNSVYRDCHVSTQGKGRSKFFFLCVWKKSNTKTVVTCYVGSIL